MPDSLPPDLHAAVVATATRHARQVAAQPPKAQPLEALCEIYDIPLSTLSAVRNKGGGPRTFTIGRRVYCLVADWETWLEALAATGGTGPLNAPRRPQP